MKKFGRSCLFGRCGFGFRNGVDGDIFDSYFQG